MITNLDPVAFSECNQNAMAANFDQSCGVAKEQPKPLFLPCRQQTDCGQTLRTVSSSVPPFQAVGPNCGGSAASVTAAKALLCRDEYCAGYIKAFREGKLI